MPLFTAWQRLEPESRLTFAIFAVSLLTPVLTAACLLRTTGLMQREQGRQWELSTARCLAVHLSRALEAQDDLLALSLLREAPGQYPQLREALVFERNGNILWHTDAGQIGRPLENPWPRGLAGGRVFINRVQGGRPETLLQVPLSGNADVYLRLVFDETSRVQAGYFLGLQTLCVLLLAAGGITLAGRRHLQAYAIFARNDKLSTPPAPTPAPARKPQPADPASEWR